MTACFNFLFLTFFSLLPLNDFNISEGCSFLYHLEDLCFLIGSLANSLIDTSMVDCDDRILICGGIILGNDDSSKEFLFI